MDVAIAGVSGLLTALFGGSLQVLPFEPNVLTDALRPQLGQVGQAPVKAAAELSLVAQKNGQEFRIVAALFHQPVDGRERAAAVPVVLCHEVDQQLFGIGSGLMFGHKRGEVSVVVGLAFVGEDFEDATQTVAEVVLGRGGFALLRRGPVERWALR